MINIDKTTGESLSGWALYASYWADVLTTLVGSRVKRRTYGCKLPRLLGKSLSGGNLARAQVWVIEAYYNPVNGLRTDAELLKVNVITQAQGFTVSLTLNYKSEIKVINL
jgi:phage baseplate assembly protein W